MSKKPQVAVRSRESAAADSSDGPVSSGAAIETSSPAFVPPAHTPPSHTQGMKKMINSTEEFVAFSKDNLEAIATSSKILATGVQDLTKEVVSTAKTSFEESMAVFKALTSVKSPQEAFELQSSYSKAAIAKMLAESNRLTDASMKLAEQAMAPLTARMNVAVGAFGKTA